MRQNHRLCRIAALCLLFAVPTAFAQIEGAAVTGGRIQGTLADGIAAFKGVPFAAAPVGDLRWKPPQPLHAWQGVLCVAGQARAHPSPTRFIFGAKKFITSQAMI